MFMDYKHDILMISVVSKSVYKSDAMILKIQQVIFQISAKQNLIYRNPRYRKRNIIFKGEIMFKIIAVFKNILQSNTDKHDIYGK